MNSLPISARGRRGLLAAGCAAAALALSPAVASADSIVYVKDANVWLASGSGGNQYQVTTDGTSAKQARAVKKLGRKSKALRLVVTAKAGASVGTRSAVVAPR